MDHWALLATAKLFNATDVDAGQFPRELWRRHAVGICRSIFVDRKAQKPLRSGDLSGDGYLCRIAVRLEGLSAARTFLRDDVWNKEYSLAMADAVALFQEVQVRGGRCDGAFARNLPGSADANEPEAQIVRIDYVQHVLNGLIQSARLAGLREAP
jgi:hypothetical protein